MFTQAFLDRKRELMAAPVVPVRLRIEPPNHHRVSPPPGERVPFLPSVEEEVREMEATGR